MFWDFWIEEFDEQLLKELGFSGACVFGKTTSSKQLKLLSGGKDFVILESLDEKAQQLAVKRCAVDAIVGYPNEKILKDMADKNIALVIRFNDLSDSKNRPKTFHYMARTAKLAKKKKTPIVICSGAKDKWGLRSASELVGFGETLGLTAKEAKEALFKFQAKIWKRQELKGAGKYISIGVVKK